MGKFFKHTGYTFLSKVFIILLQMAIYITIARVFGPQGKGIYSLAMLLPTLIIVFTNLGIDASTVYYIGKKGYSLSKIIGTNLFLVIPISLFGMLAGYFIIHLTGNSVFQGVPHFYLFLVLIIIPFTLGFRYLLAILLGQQRFIPYNSIYMIRFLLFFLLLFGGIIIHKDISIAIWTNILSLFFGFLLVLHIVLRNLNAKSLKFNREYAIKSGKFGVKSFLSNILAFLNYRLDMFLINLFSNPTEVGFYSVAVNIVERLWLIPQSAGTVLFPKVASETDEEQKRRFTPFVVRTVFWLSIFSGIILFIISKWVVILLYSSVYLKSIRPLQILLPGIAIGGVSSILSNDITARGKPMLNTYMTIITVSVNLILNLLFIPRWGINGAALASTISYLLQFIGKTLIYIRISKNPVRALFLIKSSDIRIYKGIISAIHI